MPFRSEKQRRYLWKHHPKIAKDWTDEHGSKPVKKKHGGVHNTWQNQFYRTAQKIDKAIENWPEERKRLKKNFKTNVKNLLNKIKAEGKRGKAIREDPNISFSQRLRIYQGLEKYKPVKKKHGGRIRIWGEKVETVWPTMTKDQKKQFKKDFPGHSPDDAIPQKKSGGSMDPYFGSYIKGRVDGKTLSNPSYRKYYKGLI